MNIRDRKGLKAYAQESLSCASYDPRRLFGIHIAVAAGISLLLTVLDYLLQQGIATTGGLDGIGTRSLLQTAQQLLQVAYSLALPFWQMGLFFVALQLLRRQSAEPASLLEGFRKLGPVLRQYILKILIFFGITVGGTYVGIMITMFTPLSNGYFDLMLPLAENATEEELMIMMEDPAFLEQVMASMVPMLIAVGVILLVCMLPVLYRLRVAEFALMDQPGKGARHSIKTSWRLTRGNCMALFRLDLSFWWFYGLELLLNGVYFLDVLLPNLMDPTAFFWLCNVAYCAGQIALYSWANARIQTTYAAAYEALLEQEREREAQRQAAAAAVVTPWDLPPLPPQQPEQ